MSNGLGSLWGENKVAFDNVCSGHGVLLASEQCFCDIGFTGANCQTSLKGTIPIFILETTILINKFLSINSWWIDDRCETSGDS